MIRLFTIILCAVGFVGLYAQPHDFLKDETEDSTGKTNPMKTTLEVGSQIGTSFKNSSYWSNYILPNFSYDVNERLTIKVGIGVYHTQYNNVQTLMNERTLTTINGYSSNVFGYAMGIYHMNPKLDILAGYSFSEPINTNSNIYATSGMNAANFGFNYKISSELSVGAQVGFNNQSQIGLGGLNNGFFNNGPVNYMFP